MFNLLLGLCVLFLLYFGVYWASLLSFVWIQAYSRPDTPSSDDPNDHGTVLALVPSHHEGESLVDTVRTLVHQDYLGRIEIQVLVEDFTDSSVAALKRAFPDFTLESPNRLLLECGVDQRAVYVVGVGNRAKFAKINHALERQNAAFVAFLDADHRARKGWVSDSVQVITHQQVDGVQMRKMPLSTTRLAQMWDAGLSHVTFELFNHASQKSFGLVSFTGSTAIFTGESLRTNRLADCITEDTYLSYDMLLEGRRIVYDRRIGSYEEVTPNIPSFVFRRRRWSAGHSHAFLAHLKGLFRADIPISTRVLVFFMGQFFMLPLFIAGFFWTQGIYYFALFAMNVRLLVLGLSALLALALTLWLSWRRSTKLTDFFVCWLTLLPHVAMSGALVYLLADTEAYYFITSFPYQGQLWSAQFALILAAIVTYCIAWERIRSVNVSAGIVFVVTIPLMIFFDLLSALLGFSDLVLGRREWSKIDRRNEVSEDVEEELRSQLVVAKTRRRVRVRWLYLLGAVPLFTVCTVSVNDVMSVDQCGNLDPLLWDPIFVDSDNEPVLNLDVSTTVRGDSLDVLVRSIIRSPNGGPIELRVFDGTEQVERFQIEAPQNEETLDVQLNWPIGWDTKTVRVAFASTGLVCRIEREVPTRVVQMDSSGLRVNGEPFLMKGMVPTFSAPGVGLDVDEGYQQLKNIGINTVRLYHPPTATISNAARAHNIFMIPQPDGSTWESVNPSRLFDLNFYARRWRALVRKTEGNPFVLMLNAGNELEIDDRSPSRIDGIRNLLTNANKNHAGLTTYSTFATFIDYPVDILGINMLDSGPTYWDQSLGLVKHMNRPFFASEFGGFVAFFESTPPLLRQWRMHRQFYRLQDRGALGSIFFASHDNWSQAVPPGGYNDPFTGDHPDDRRGYWDQNNIEKPELEMLKHLLADVDIAVTEPIDNSTTPFVSLTISNRRPYQLQDVAWSYDGGGRYTVGDLSPYGSHIMTVPREALQRSEAYPRIPVQFTFTSHRGLSGAGQWPLAIPDPTNGPTIVGDPVFNLQRTDTRLTFTALLEGEAELIVPSTWRKVQLGDVVRTVENGRVPLRLPAPIQPVTNLQMSKDGTNWETFDGQSFGTGDSFIRFDLPPSNTERRALVLSGLAATRVLFRWSDGDSREGSHAYRETLIDVSDRSGAVSARFKRVRPRYLKASESPTQEEVPIYVDRPYIFAPQTFEVTRVE